MTNEIDRSRRELADSIEEDRKKAEELRRKEVNLYAAQQNLIDEGEDLFNDWEDAHKHDLKSVKHYVEGRSQDWKETKKALDDIADPGITISRRDIVKWLLGSAAVGAAGWGASDALFGRGSGTSGSSDPYANLPRQGERMEWSEAERYLDGESASRIVGLAEAEGLNLSDARLEFQYEGIENGQVKGYTEVYVPDDAIGQPDKDSNPEEIEFDNMIYQQVK